MCAQTCRASDYISPGLVGQADAAPIAHEYSNHQLLHCLHQMMIQSGRVQVSLAAEDIRNEKVKVLKCMKAMSMDDVVLGQYRARSLRGQNHPGYLDDKTVPPDRSVARAL